MFCTRAVVYAASGRGALEMMYPAWRDTYHSWRDTSYVLYQSCLSWIHNQIQAHEDEVRDWWETNRGNVLLACGTAITTIGVGLVVFFCVRRAWRNRAVYYARLRQTKWVLERNVKHRATPLAEYMATTDYLRIAARAEDRKRELLCASVLLPSGRGLAPVLHEGCVQCMAAAYSLTGDTLTLALYTELQKLSGPEGAHAKRCPFSYEMREHAKPEDYSLCTAYIAMNLFLGDFNPTSQSPKVKTVDVEDASTLEARGKKKAPKNKSFMSASWEQFEKVDPNDKVQVANQRMAELRDYAELVQQYEGDDPRDRLRTHLAWREYHELREDLDLFFAEEAAQGGERGRRMQRDWQQRRRECGLPTPALKKVTLHPVNPEKNLEAAPREVQGDDPNTLVLYGDDERVVSMPRGEAIKAVAAAMVASSASRPRHNEIVQQRTVPNKRREKQLESALPNSMPYQLGGNTVLIEDLSTGRTRHGLIGQVNNTLMLGTCRHDADDSGMRDMPIAVDTPVRVHVCNRQIAFNATVMCNWAPQGHDEVWHLLDATTATFPIVNNSFATYDAKTVGQSVSIYTARLLGGIAVWTQVPGKVVHADEEVVGYDMTTVAGDCRAPVYNSKGQVLVGHLYGSQTDGRKLFNAGVPYHVPPNKGVFREKNAIPPYDVQNGRTMQGKVVEQPGLLNMLVDKYRSMEEDYKIYPLRQDVDLSGLKLDYYMMRPSTQLNKQELGRFGDVLSYQTDAEVLGVAMDAAVEQDANCRMPATEITADRILCMIDEMDVTNKSSGFTGRGRPHDAYIRMLGGGNKAFGREVLCARTLKLYHYMCDRDDTAEAEHLYTTCSHWMVSGKKDGYKEKKLDVGRTVQAPCLEMKLLWKVAYGEGDRAWTKRPEDWKPWVHSGHDYDRPVKGLRRQLIAESVGAGALDATAFDRYMEKDYISSFFLVHLPLINPGLPLPFRQKMADFVCRGPLVVSDGTVYFKERGNPSGFMNTLRLNCWANLVAWCYALGRRLQALGKECTVATICDVLENHLYVEICGDDSRFWALTEFGSELLDLPNNMSEMLKIWNDELPWAVKLEGCATWEKGSTLEKICAAAPSMVSRCLFICQNQMWESLSNVSRALKRLAHDDGRKAEEEEEVVRSAYTTLALPVWLARQKLYYSAPLSFLMREFPGEKYMALAASRAADLWNYVGEPLDFY